MIWDKDDLVAADRPAIRIHREDEARDDSAVRLDVADEPESYNIDDYWAGRNLAARISARVAA